MLQMFFCKLRQENVSVTSAGFYLEFIWFCLEKPNKSLCSILIKHIPRKSSMAGVVSACRESHSTKVTLALKCATYFCKLSNGFRKQRSSTYGINNSNIKVFFKLRQMLNSSLNLLWDLSSAKYLSENIRNSD